MGNSNIYLRKNEQTALIIKMNYLETDGKTVLFAHGSIPCAMEKDTTEIA